MIAKPNTRPEPHISLREIDKDYLTSGSPYPALKSVSMEIDTGEFVTVVGASGSGKSTLLNLIAGIDRPTRGEIKVGPSLVHQLDENALSVWRGKNVGIVFQFFQLLPTLTCLENVLLPMDFAGSLATHKRTPRALELLKRMGVEDQAHKLPGTLSGGQRQRVAIARALANDPPLIVADEPTGNLDSKTSLEMIELFAQLSREGKTVVMVTHELDASAFADRTITLVDGEIDRSLDLDPVEEVCHV